MFNVTGWTQNWFITNLSFLPERIIYTSALKQMATEKVDLRHSSVSNSSWCRSLIRTPQFRSEQEGGRESSHWIWGGVFFSTTLKQRWKWLQATGRVFVSSTNCLSSRSLVKDLCCVLSSLPPWASLSGWVSSRRAGRVLWGRCRGTSWGSGWSFVRRPSRWRRPLWC